MTATAAKHDSATAEATDETAEETGAAQEGGDAAGEAAGPVSVPKTRDYHVLEEVTLPEQLRGLPSIRSTVIYNPIGVFNAATSKQATELATKNAGEGKYVAIAASSWNEHEAKLKQVEPQMVIE